MSKLFKNALFGYRKKDVNEYIEQISTDFTQKLAEKDAEIDDLKSQRTKLDEMRAKLEKEKAAVSDAIVSAHEEGERIIAAAREKAAEIRQDTERKTTAENSKLIKIRREIHNIKRNAIKTLSALASDEDSSDSE